jgi:hypothetical protein
MDLVGVSTDQSAKNIDYSERPKLVMPPRVGELPPPREGAERPGGWPADVGATRRRDTDRYAKLPNAAPEEKKPGLLERIRGPKTDDEPGFLQRALSGRHRNTGSTTAEPNRRLLTDPPAGYRQPTKDLSTVVDTDPRKTSWWNPLSYLGGSGNDNDPVAQQGASMPAPQRGGAANGGGLLSGMMPSFLRGSDKD